MAARGPSGPALYNAYGPTEATVLVTLHRLRPEEGAAGRAPVGRPIAGVDLAVVDPGGAPLPIGAAGELVLAGPRLAQGYAGRPELTADRFRPDPFSGRPGERLYRTGDRARFAADGALELSGRLDAQVKIRGYRIEPGEIEAALAAHPRVFQAAVEARLDVGGGLRLVAFVVGEEGEEPTAEELARYLADRLPAPYVPRAWRMLPALPVTASGKLDRRALARLKVRADEGAAEDYLAPRTPLEEKLAATCAEVLELPRVGMRDSFFALGGHSLLAVRFVARLADRWGIEVPLRALFEVASLAELADRITEDELVSAAGPELEEMLGELEGLSPEEIEALLGGEGEKGGG